ncbi:MAG: bifunctional UDP-N-acetylglucosamine diphosphorylase/glucosamine-1-phosphate N-acetyltransferase GlmU, partial [Planktomarina sp.]
HEIAHAPMLIHAMRAGRTLEPKRTVVVAGHGASLVDKAAKQFDPSCDVVLQTEQLGTGHAVAQARNALDGFEGNVIVLYGDTPLIQADTLRALEACLSSASVAVLGFDAADPGRYGRLIADGDQLDRIVEYKDATPQERDITLCNSGVMAVPCRLLFDLLSSIDNNNASGEYYLTDVVALARKRDLLCRVVKCPEAETLGVNSRVELAQAESEFQSRMRQAALISGVTMPAPETVHFAFDTQVANDTIVEQNVVFGPGVTVETGAKIRAFSHLEGAHVASGCVVGPYARLRPGVTLSSDVKIGNFVEIKASQLDAGSKVNHLSYIGDAHVGERTNIGAGTITCNYDGVFKHKTVLGADAFIGSNTMLVAPVTVGDNAMTASGSVITKDIPDDALALARGTQTNKPGLAKKLFSRLRAIKAAKKGS